MSYDPNDGKFGFVQGFMGAMHCRSLTDYLYCLVVILYSVGIPRNLIIRIA